MRETLLEGFSDFVLKCNLNLSEIQKVEVFQNSCIELKYLIDKIDIATEWKNFLSPKGISTNLIRSAGIETPLNHLYRELETENMLSATKILLEVLKDEILHEVTLVR